MLFNVASNCSPELLYCLPQMGHGDDLERSFINLPVARYIHHYTYDDAG